MWKCTVCEWTTWEHFWSCFFLYSLWFSWECLSAGSQRKNITEFVDLELSRQADDMTTPHPFTASLGLVNFQTNSWGIPFCVVDGCTMSALDQGCTPPGRGTETYFQLLSLQNKITSSEDCEVYYTAPHRRFDIIQSHLGEHRTVYN